MLTRFWSVFLFFTTAGSLKWEHWVEMGEIGF